MTPRLVRTLLLVSVVAVSIFCAAMPALAAPAESLPASHPTYQAVKSIYDRVARAFSDERPAPVLVIEPAPSNTIAVFRAGNEEQVLLAAPAPGVGGAAAAIRLQESRIVIGEELYQRLAPLGDRRDSALALLIGHELAHFYRRHKAMNEFGRAFAAETSPPGSRNLSAAEQEKLEGEADLFGGFYGYLAGYQTFDISSKTYQIIYRSYELSDKLPGYPGLDLRVKIAQGAEQNLKRLVQAFDCANRLLVLGYHSEAARLYRFIARTFPSCEIQNNAGVALALAALDEMPADAAGPYSFPFELDLESRLGTRGGRASKGGNWRELLKEAGECFDAAIRQNGNYATAYLNRAAVYQLLGKSQLAEGFVEEAVTLAAEQPTTRASALTVRGIVAAGKNRKDQAAADFAEAARLGSAVASYNAALLAGKPPVKEEGARENSFNWSEKIAGRALTRPAAIEAPFFSLRLEATAADGELSVLGDRLSGGELYSFYEYDADGNGPFQVDLLVTAPGYAGATARGIKIGSDVGTVKAEYGEPARVVAARQGSYLVYQRSRIAFQLTPDGKLVAGWMLFSKPFRP